MKMMFIHGHFPIFHGKNGSHMTVFYPNPYTDVGGIK